MESDGGRRMGPSTTGAPPMVGEPAAPSGQPVRERNSPKTYGADGVNPDRVPPLAPGGQGEPAR